MATVNPIHLSQWVNFTTTIDATQVRAEFQNIYNAINGGLDGSNIQDGSLTGNEFADNSIPGSKINSIPANKITGQLTVEQLPGGILNTTGGTVTGTLTFNVAATTPFLKKLNDEPVILLEAGTGPAKIQIIVEPNGSALKIVKNGVTFLEITNEGRLIPFKFKVPVV